MTNRSAKARLEEIIRSRGPDYQRLVELRREHERVRKREARKQQTPEQLGSGLIDQSQKATAAAIQIADK